MKQTAAPRHWPPSRHTILKCSLLVASLAIALTVDLVTKHLADERLALGEVRHILPFFDLERTANNGVAFGLLGGNRAVIVVANVIALLVILAYVAYERHPILAGIAGGAVMGGSIGNMVQRLSGDGLVTDFGKFPHWPNFNMADVFIDAGIAAIFLGLVVELVLTWRRSRPRRSSS